MKTNNGWLPIADAPRDGTPILGYGESPFTEDEGKILATRWQDYSPLSQAGKLYELGEGPRGYFHLNRGGASYSWKPTYFQPIIYPETPTQEGGL